jgi:hypothetical protein
MNQSSSATSEVVPVPSQRQIEFPLLVERRALPKSSAHRILPQALKPFYVLAAKMKAEAGCRESQPASGNYIN